MVLLTVFLVSIFAVTAIAEPEFNEDFVEGPSLGAGNAPVTIVWFGDYQGPFNKNFYKETFPKIKTNYINKGLVQIVFHDFPLSFHPWAQEASEAAHCAGEQGKYWQYQRYLFWKNPDFDYSTFRTLAKKSGINVPEFTQCLMNGKYTNLVENNFAEAADAGITGTPQFFINDKPLLGAQPYSVFKAMIDAELAGLSLYEDAVDDLQDEYKDLEDWFDDIKDAVDDAIE